MIQIRREDRYHVDDLYVGDVVEVISDGAMFSTYDSWFGINNSKYYSFWKMNDNIIIGKEFILVEKAVHHQRSDMVYLIQCTSTMQVYLIGRYGLKLLMRPSDVNKENNSIAADVVEDTMESRFDGIL